MYLCSIKYIFDRLSRGILYNFQIKYSKNCLFIYIEGRGNEIGPALNCYQETSLTSLFLGNFESKSLKEGRFTSALAIHCVKNHFQNFSWF